MRIGKELRPTAYARSPRFHYLPEQDRYLVAKKEARYKLNIIGAGIMGAEHIRLTWLEGRAAVHGIYDPNPGSVQSAQRESEFYAPGHQLVIYDSLEAACNDPDVDGLIICTPNYTHLDVLRVAAPSGKHILLEKPIATTVPDAWEITQIARSYPAVFQIGLQYRYKPIYRESIYEVQQRGTVGNVKTVSIMEHRIPFLDKVNQWNKFARFSGDTLVEKCCHYFDLLNLFAGAPAISVFASGAMDVNFTEFEYDGAKSDILDNALVIVNYANGVRARFDLCMFAPLFYEELVVCGDNAHLKAWEREDFTKHDQKARLEITAGVDQTTRVSELAYHSTIGKSGHSGATFYEHKEFIDRIEGQPTSMATAEEGFNSIAVAAAAQESIKRGQVVQIADYLATFGIKWSV